MRALVVAAVPLLIVSTTAVLPPTASAETITVPDSTTTEAGIDIHAVKVRHERRLTVTIHHEDIDRGDNSSVDIWIDTVRNGKGAELYYSAGISGESDYEIWRARGWRGTGDLPLNCAIGLHNDYSANTTRATIGRGCLGQTNRLRVSVRAVEYVNRNDRVVDWAPGRKAWSPWVDRG